ncbi:MAG: hypothetical protein KJ556_21785 [Gammaproteobacteria bacterium]|nr:hypothetical protein [Gammaproteobacteria bacterium]
MKVHISIAVDIDGRKSFREFSEYEMTPESLRRHITQGQGEVVLRVEPAKVLFPTARLISMMEGDTP